MERAFRTAIGTATRFEEIPARERELLDQLEELEASLAVEHAATAALAHRLGLEEGARRRAEEKVTSLEEQLGRGSLPAPPPPAPREPMRGETNLVRSLARELFDGTRSIRSRAADRLFSLLGIDASSLLGSALETERDPSVLAAICELLGKTGDGEAFPGVSQLLQSDVPLVRAAAVNAALRLAREDDERIQVVKSGISDPDASVRRRTALAAASTKGFEAGPWVSKLLRDEDRHARRLACVTLAATEDPPSALALVEALLDPDEGVRSAAGASAGRLFGRRAQGISSLPQGERERAVASLRAYVSSNLRRLAPEGRLLPLAACPADTLPEARAADAPAPAEPEVVADVRPAPAEPEAVAEVRPAPAELETVADAFAPIEGVLLAALRGATLEGLAADLGESVDALALTMENHLAEGRVVRRGKKFFLP